MQSLVYIQRRQLYYSTVFGIRQHKIADFATREGAPLPSPLGEGGPAGPDEGVSFRAADHKRAAEQEAPLSKGAVRAADWGIPALYGSVRIPVRPQESLRPRKLGHLPLTREAFWLCPFTPSQTFSPSPAPPGRYSWGSCPAPRRQWPRPGRTILRNRFPTSARQSPRPRGPARGRTPC